MIKINPESMGEIMRRNGDLWVGLLTVAVLVFSSVPAEAGSPWKWQMSLNLKKEQLGNQMLQPTGLYIDKERERYYVVDAGTNSLHSFDLKGGHLNTLKPGDQLRQPYAMVRDRRDVLWLVEKGRNTLTEIDLKEKKIVNHELKAGGREVFPDRLAMVGDDFFVIDKLSGRIVVLGQDLKVKREIGCGDCRGGLRDFAVEEGGDVWGLNVTDKQVYRFSGDGRLLKTIDIGGEVSFPYAIDLGPSGQIYVLDRHDGSVVVFDNSGSFKYRFLAKGQNRGRLYYPEDIQFDFWGRLCVVDSGNGRVELFSR